MDRTFKLSAVFGLVGGASVLLLVPFSLIYQRPASAALHCLKKIIATG